MKIRPEFHIKENRCLHAAKSDLGQYSNRNTKILLKLIAAAALEMALKAKIQCKDGDRYSETVDKDRTILEYTSNFLGPKLRLQRPAKE